MKSHLPKHSWISTGILIGFTTLFLQSVSVGCDDRPYIDNFTQPVPVPVVVAPLDQRFALPQPAPLGEFSPTQLGQMPENYQALLPFLYQEVAPNPAHEPSKSTDFQYLASDWLSLTAGRPGEHIKLSRIALFLLSNQEFRLFLMDSEMKKPTSSEVQKITSQARIVGVVNGTWYVKPDDQGKRPRFYLTSGTQTQKPFADLTPIDPISQDRPLTALLTLGQNKRLGGFAEKNLIVQIVVDGLGLVSFEQKLKSKN